LAGDEDRAKTIDAWIAEGRYTELLDLWVKGLFSDWNRIYGDKKPRRISLPTYVFAKEHYWVSFNQVKDGSVTIVQKVANAGSKGAQYESQGQA